MNAFFLECAGIQPWAVPYFLQHISRNAAQYGLELSSANVSVSVELSVDLGKQLQGVFEADLTGFKAWVEVELDTLSSGLEVITIKKTGLES
jgi:hypothetical protein